MSETALLNAVRDVIRQRCNYRDHECEVEFDELAPANVGEVYLAVQPGGFRPGPTNASSGGVLDELYDVEVTVAIRCAKVPRDRQREVFAKNLEGLNSRLRAIVAAVGNFSYEVLNLANAEIVNTQNSNEGFIEPLKFGGVDSKPRMIGPDFFAAVGNDQRAGMARTVRLVGARRIQTGAVAV